jgi:O-antigen ligase
MEPNASSISLNNQTIGERKSSRLTSRLIKIQAVASILFLIFCFILHIFIRSNPVFPWLNLSLFLTTFTTCLINPLISLGILTFLTPFTATISEQVKAVFNLEIFTLDLLSIDASIGFLAGILFLNLFSKNRKIGVDKLSDKTRVLAFLLLNFHVLIIITVAIAISRNLYQAASPYSVKGFFYNLANIRYIGWHDDYFPLKDLFIFTTVITLSISLLSLVQTKFQLRWSVLCPLFSATLIILSYALLSKFTGIGYNRDDIIDFGVNSFFPDIHAYGGYALAAFIGGFYYLFSPKTTVKLAAGTFSLLAAVGVIVSGSRFTIVMLFVTPLIYIYICFFLNKKINKNLLVFVFIALIVATAAISLGYWGNRNLFRDLALVPKANSFAEFSAALSDRPEIFRSALLMYVHYPILGLGKGIFFRQSSIFEFSHSVFFALQYNGQNAHNYFLQILAETGIVGLILFCTLFLYQARYLRNRHNQIVTVLVLGIFSGNLYGHSLLIPNLLVLLFILLGASNTEVQNDSVTMRFLPTNLSKRWRYFLISVATVAILLAVTEVITSYGKLPFQSKYVCYKPILYSDKHTSGFFKGTYKVIGNNLAIEYAVYHPDTQRRPLTINFDIEQKGQKVARYKRTLTSSGHYQENFDISKLTSGSDVLLGIKTSRCFTPVNLGFNLDNRRLGIQLNEVSQDKRVVQSR